MCQYVDMICINCFHEKTTVANSRAAQKTSEVWRRRHCPQCKASFTTYERPSLVQKSIYHGDRETTPFSLSKLTLSIAAALAHSPKSRELHSLSLAQTVEQLLLREVREPSVGDIIAITHQVLNRFDAVAGLQYAAQHGIISPTRTRRGRPSIR